MKLEPFALENINYRLVFFHGLNQGTDVQWMEKRLAVMQRLIDNQPQREATAPMSARKRKKAEEMREQQQLV